MEKKTLVLDIDETSCCLHGVSISEFQKALSEAFSGKDYNLEFNFPPNPINAIYDYGISRFSLNTSLNSEVAAVIEKFKEVFFQLSATRA